MVRWIVFRPDVTETVGLAWKTNDLPTCLLANSVFSLFGDAEPRWNPISDDNGYRNDDCRRHSLNPDVSEGGVLWRHRMICSLTSSSKLSTAKKQIPFYKQLITGKSQSQLNITVGSRISTQQCTFLRHEETFKTKIDEHVMMPRAVRLLFKSQLGQCSGVQVLSDA